MTSLVSAKVKNNSLLPTGQGSLRAFSQLGRFVSLLSSFELPGRMHGRR